MVAATGKSTATCPMPAARATETSQSATGRARSTSPRPASTRAQGERSCSRLRVSPAASAEASNVNGAVVTADGGWTAG
jgi:hypothetical protein